MLVEIQLSQEDVKKLILDELSKRLGEVHLDKTKVFIETKSKQNYKSEWETADFRVTYKVQTV